MILSSHQYHFLFHICSAYVGLYEGLIGVVELDLLCCFMNKNPKVNAYMSKLDTPLIEIWEKIREIILNVDQTIEEDIKWGAPTFIYKGNIATFNPRAKKFVNLTFHTGALIDDPDKVLEGKAKEARVFRVSSIEELIEKKTGLEKLIVNWIKQKDG